MFGRGDGSTADLREIIPIRPQHPLDHPKVQQSPQLARQAGRREPLKLRHELTAPDADDVDPRVLQGVQQRPLAGRGYQIRAPA